jgi:hypothetical protein
VPKADDNVEGDPSHGEPARPIAAAEHEDAGDNGECAGKLYPYGVVLQELAPTEFRKIVDEPDRSGSDEK